MKKMFQRGLPILVTLSLSILFSCNSDSHKKDGETALISKKEISNFDHSEPLNLKLVVNDTYAIKTACSCIHYLACREYEELQEILINKYNIDLELIYCIEEFHLEDSIRTQKYDGAICKPWFALQYEPESGTDFIRIVDIIDPFENQFLAGSFIVRNESPIQDAADIQGKVLYTGKENSYEKFHASRQLLDSEGIEPKLIREVSSCVEGINALLDKVADVSVISDYSLVASCAVDLAPADSFRVIWQTEDMPLCSVLLDLNKVKKADAERLQAALLEITENNIIPESFASNGFVNPMPWTPNPYMKKDKK